MPQVLVGAAASAVMAGFTSGFTAAVLGQAFIGSLILGGLSHALTPKPKKPSAMSNIASNTFTIRQPDSTRKHIYGLTRFTDVFAQMVSTGVNGKIHAIILLCDDEIDSYLETWVNDYPISPDHIDANGDVTTGRYAGKLRIRYHLGAASQVADSVLVAEVPEWDSTCTLSGIAYVAVTLTKDQDVYPNGMPNFSFVVRGKKIYDPRTSQTVWTPNCALFCYDFIGQAEYGFRSEEDDVDLTNISAQANISDEIVDTEELDTDIDTVTHSTDIITLDGDRLMYEIGDRVELVTAGTPPAGLATGTDYYIIPYQFKTTPRIKLATSLSNAIVGTAIDITSAGSGSMLIRKTGEPRYHGAGVVDTADTLEDSLNAMLTGIAGRAVNIGGAWTLLAGAWRTPVNGYGIDDFRGDMGTRTRIPIAERYNTINGLYISQINDWQKADYPPYRNQNYIDADLKEYPKNMPLSFSTRPTTCKRIAKLEVLRARLEKIYSVPLSMAGMLTQVGDNVMITLERREWDEKEFEVTQFGFSVLGDGDNVELITDITARETAEAIYDWASSTDDPPLNIIPNTNLPNPFIVPGVTGLAFSSRYINTQDLDVLYTLVLSWDLHPDAFVVNNGLFEIQFKLHSEPDTEWQPSFFVAGILTSSDVLVSSINTQYDLRIRAINNLGVRSAWTTIENAVVGSSGGVGTTNDWGSVADSVGPTNDWGTVDDTVGTTNDWGTVT